MCKSCGRHGLGALPPPDVAWQTGKTALVIRVVGLLEKYVAAGNYTASERKIIFKRIEGYKNGRMTALAFTSSEISDDALLSDEMDSLGIPKRD